MASPTYSNMNESQKFERCFLALGIIGFTLLWPVMIYDGTIWALLQVAWTGVYRDGRPLLRTYTWVPPFDFMIRVLVAFFDDTINGIDNAGWYLMLDLVTTIGVAIIWVLIDAVRIDQKQKLLRILFIWPLLWNMFGTAAVLPVYLYLHTKHVKFEKLSPTISTPRPQLLTIATILVAAIPPFIMFSAYNFEGDFKKHAVIAVYVLSPLVLGLITTIISATDSKYSESHRTSSERILYSLLLGALVSGCVHIYTMASTCLTQDESFKFGRVFIPSLSSVAPGSIDNIHTGALLFLQYDWIVVCVTCAVWVYLLLDSRQVVIGVQGFTTRVLLILVSTLLIGPGATVSSALYLREQNLLGRHKETARR